MYCTGSASVIARGFSKGADSKNVLTSNLALSGFNSSAASDLAGAFDPPIRVRGSCALAVALSSTLALALPGDPLLDLQLGSNRLSTRGLPTLSAARRL